jgi:hypothetical protein
MVENLDKKIDDLCDLLKALMSDISAKNNKQLFTIKPIASLQSLPKPNIKNSAKIAGIAPSSNKDPKKIAQQIKDGSMSTKTQKILTKSETIGFLDNGQWFIS